MQRIVSFKESPNIINSITEFISQLIKKLASEEEFIANFTELNYTNDNVPLLCYIFDRFNNFGLDPSTYLRIYDPDPKLLRRNHNIEHFLPQNPDPSLKVQKETLEYVDNIGNLIAISYKTNSRLGNANPATKIERLNGDLSKDIQNTVYVKEFINKYGGHASAWEKDAIIKRAKDMAEEAYGKIWRIDKDKG